MVHKQMSRIRIFVVLKFHGDRRFEKIYLKRLFSEERMKNLRNTATDSSVKSGIPTLTSS